MNCGIIVPRRSEIIGERSDGYLPECILKTNHSGPHIFRTPENNFYAWEDDWSCGCCTPEEDDRCYTYRQLSKEETTDLEQEQK
jgi:hypothetical protein